LPTDLLAHDGLLPSRDSKPGAMNMIETATLGGGCFWCLEAVYLDVAGVTAVESGYAGGAGRNPTYEQVCGGQTGHAEVVKIDFDTERISFREILQIFFVIHDPTTLNRQGNDVGTQYRSVIFTHSDVQATTAREVIEEIEEKEIIKEIEEAIEIIKEEIERAIKIADGVGGIIVRLE
jgi:methionine-S-sulfoxide reductase